MRISMGLFSKNLKLKGHEVNSGGACPGPSMRAVILEVQPQAVPSPECP